MDGARVDDGRLDDGRLDDGRLDSEIGGHLDAAAGLPLHPLAREAWLAASEDGWADPARLTGASRRSAVLLDAARESIAESLAVRPDEVVFLPSGTHALQAAVLGTLTGRRRAGSILVHSAVEHTTVLRAAQWHSHQGFPVVEVGVDHLARVDPAAFVAAARRPGVAAAVLQAANHEVGTRQPIGSVAAALAGSGVPLVVDASQSVLYESPPQAAGVFSVDPSLWGGPRGVGILVVRQGVRWQSPWPTDDTERGRSAGVVDVPAAVGAAVSLRAVRSAAAESHQRLFDLIERIRTAIPERVPDSVVLGDPVDRVPHIVTFSCLYVDGQSVLTELDRRGFAVSSGSSCSADTLTPSHVLVAMGALTSGNVRVSIHPATRAQDVERFLDAVAEVVAEVRSRLPVSKPSEGTTIDSRGRRCPLPIIDLARAIGGVPVGAVVTVLADDPAAASDIAAWCRMRGHEFVDATPLTDQATAYNVRRVG